LASLCLYEFCPFVQIISIPPICVCHLTLPLFFLFTPFSFTLSFCITLSKRKRMKEKQTD
jgi:hypothetical protein